MMALYSRWWRLWLLGPAVTHTQIAINIHNRSHRCCVLFVEQCTDDLDLYWFVCNKMLY